MKKTTKILTAVSCLTVLTACSTNAEVMTSATMTSSDAATDKIVIGENDTTTVSEEAQENNAQDYEKQLELIAENYDSLSEQYLYDDYEDTAFFAVTDFNHNGRLEFILTSCQGSGWFSYTKFFEVSEDRSALVSVENDAFSSEMADATCDFTMNMEPVAHSEVYDCYEKDGEYFYLIQDYCCSGWKEKSMSYSSYCFRDKIETDYIGGCYLSVNPDTKKISVSLTDSSNNYLSDDEQYAKALNAFWNGYERQKCCEVIWVPLSDKELFANGLKDSLDGFDPDSDKHPDIVFDYKARFGNEYESDYEFVIQDT